VYKIKLKSESYQHLYIKCNFSYYFVKYLKGFLVVQNLCKALRIGHFFFQSPLMSVRVVGVAAQD